MSINLRSLNLQNLYQVLSAVDSNCRANHRDKRLISRYVENLLKEIHLMRYQEDLHLGILRKYSLSIDDKIYLLAAKSKFEILSAEHVFDGCFGTSRVVPLMKKLFFHPLLNSIIEEGYVALDFKKRNENFVSIMNRYGDPETLPSLKSSCWILIQKTIEFYPVLLLTDISTNVSEYARFNFIEDLVSFIEGFYRLSLEREMPESFRSKMVFTLIKNLNSEKRRAVFQSMDPSLSDFFIADFVNCLQSTIIDQDESYKKS